MNTPMIGRVSHMSSLLLLALLYGCAPSPDDAQMQDVAASNAPKVPITSASPEALALYQQGQGLFDELRFVDAHDLFRQAVAADDEFAMGHYMLATTALSTQEFFAEVARSKALAANVTEGERLYIQAQAAAAENDQPAQQAALQQLVGLYPQDERTHFQLANYFFAVQDFAAAVTHFQHATGIAADFAPAYNMLGYARRSLDDLDSARDAFEKYVELNANEANPYDSLAELLLEMGNYEEAVSNYRKALELNVNFASANSGLSVAYSLMGEADMAQQAARDMLATARNFPERQAAMFRSVTSYLFAGDPDAALNVCEQILTEAVAEENHSAMGGVNEYMGDIKLSAGHAKAAEQYYDAAFDHRLMANLNEATNAQASRAHLFKTAIVAMMAGDSEAAAARTAEYQAAAEAHGNTFEKLRASELAGYLAMDQEDIEAAAMHFAKASQVQPIPLYWAAVVNKELGNMDQARALAARAAHRNTLNFNMPFFHADAVALLAELSGS